MTRTAALVLWAGVLVGCGGPEVDPATDVLQSGGVSLLKEVETYTGDVGGMGAGGTLAVVDGCLGVTAESGGPAVIVFPPSASLSGAGDDLVVSVDGAELRVGDRFESGTRSSGPTGLGGYGDLDEQAPESCRDLPAYQMDGFVRR